ncbi:hypothetical protein M2102_000556 [Fusobacterium sp. PH5-7]|uniref:hypothetical protein n=1 Tax=Fusobacterium sp. PH5-7 TaxID=2940528 RepID=UPI002474CE4C|nr:hypothetical protein [Fusobacterium sp. PH5-7]MDH6456941.1 hypothetical protein [Fusobacterium sp. PH5-7]
MINTQIKELINPEEDKRLVKIIVKGFLKLIYLKIIKREDITKEAVEEMIEYFKNNTNYKYKQYIK